AFTGEISAPMLRALFATHVILGHSERRILFGERDEAINKKVLTALKNQLRPILCVGETLAERDVGATLKVVQTQLEAGLEEAGQGRRIAGSERHRRRPGRWGEPRDAQLCRFDQGGGGGEVAFRNLECGALAPLSKATDL